MWIGKWSILVGVLFLSGCTVSSTDLDAGPEISPPQAWWLTKQFPATSESVLGVSVSDIHTGWKAVSLINRQVLKSHLDASQYQDVENSNLQFHLTADLNGDSVDEAYWVGVYQGEAGERGRVLLIVQNGKVLKSLYEPGFGGFSALYKSGKEIRWYKCMECGDYDVVGTAGNDFFLE